MPDFLSIPGNIRQQYMPFTVSGNGKKQLFSFKPKRKGANVAIIHPFSQWTKTLIESDSGIQYTHGPDSGNKVDYDTFLDKIPAIQIREYVPDAKLTQTFKWFSYFKKGFDAGLQNIDKLSFNMADLKPKIEEAMERLGEKMKNLTSGDANLLSKVVEGLAHYYQDKGFNLGSDDGFAVLFLPFVLYYRLTTTHTNNIYELPYSMQNNIFQSDGTYGWTGSTDDFGIMNFVNNTVGDNALAKMVLGNTIKVNVMPSFQPTGEAQGDTITITFDLINDTSEAAINNFLFCHTLFGNNKWLQYGFVQAGSSVYDVKLPGANRYFMCSGRFVCKGKGAFRSPSTAICKGIVNHNHATNTFAGNLDKGEGTYSGLKKQMVDSRANTLADQYIQEQERSLKRSVWNNTPPFTSPIYQYNTQLNRQTSTLINSTNTTVSYGPLKSNVVGNSVVKSPTEVKTAYTNYKEIKTKVVAKENEVSNLVKNRVQELNKNIENLQTDVANAQTNVDVAKQNVEEAKSSEAMLKGQYEANPTEENKATYEEAKSFREQCENELADKEANLASAESDLTATREALNSPPNYGSEDIAKERETLESATKKMNTAHNELAKALEPNAQAQIDSQFSVAAAKVDSKYIANLIKIPDVYSIELTFTSLIPDNFNNYLYGFRAGNLDPIDNYFKSDVDEIGAFDKLVEQLQKAIE